MKTAVSFFEQNGGAYTRFGDVLLPNLTLEETDSKPLGKYGRMRKRYRKDRSCGQRKSASPPRAAVFRLGLARRSPLFYNELAVASYRDPVAVVYTMIGRIREHAV